MSQTAASMRITVSGVIRTVNLLTIAEKPSVAQSLARVIGATKRQDGYLEGPCRSSGPAFRADRSGAETGYLVSWCVGHLVEL